MRSKRRSSASRASTRPIPTPRNGTTSLGPRGSAARSSRRWRPDMGLRSIKMPDVGEGVAEAEIVEWHVKVGDAVREDQPVAAVMTDKATVEIPAPVAGTVVALGGAVGEVLAVGSELIRIDAPGLPDSPPPAPRKAAAAKPEALAPAAAAVAAETAPVDEAPRDAEAQASVVASPAAPQTGAPRPPGERPLASPAVRAR